jgi:hypothetical protein
LSPFAALALAIAGLAALSLIVSTLRLGIGPLPTSREVRGLILSLCPEDTRGLAYELGSGWGGLARALARRCPRAQVVGLEAAFVPWAFSRMVQALVPLPNLTLRRADFLKQPLDEAALAVCYLFTGAMQRLSTHLSPRTTLVSSTFALPGRTPAQTVRANDLYRTPVYLYAADPLVQRPRAD